MIELYEGAGFKGSLKRLAGATIKLKILMFFEEIRMAWQRAMYGYSQSDVWDLDHYIANLMKYTLKSFNGSMEFVLRDPDTDTGLSDKEAHEVIDRMITCIEMANDDELCAYEADVDNAMLNSHITAYEVRKKYQKEAFELLSKYWDQLWL